MEVYRFMYVKTNRIETHKAKRIYIIRKKINTRRNHACDFFSTYSLIIVGKWGILLI